MYIYIQYSMYTLLLKNLGLVRIYVFERSLLMLTKAEFYLIKIH